VLCVLYGVLGRFVGRWHRQRGAAVVDGRPPPPLWRPYSSRDGRPFDLSADAMLEDTEDLQIASAVAAHIHALHHWRKRAHGSRVHRRPRYIGSVPDRRPAKWRNFRSGLRAILRDYFGLNWEPPVYNEVDFERRFRVPRSVFLRIYNAVKDRPFFAQRINATGRLQAHPLQKVVAAFRVIAYVEVPDRTDEYVRLSASTIAMSVRELMRFIVDEFGPSYLRAPTPEELQRILTRNAERGMPRCMGSLNCSQWEWRNCPKAFAGMYKNHHEKRSVVMETVCDEDLWIWHLFVGCPGSHNDLNVLHVSPIYLSVTKGEWPPRTFSYTAKGTTPTLLYYLVDGIYPRIAFFVSPFPDPTTEVEVTFNRLQEAMREDVERLYAVLTARFHVAFHPAKYSTVEQMVTVTKAVAILHNMVTEKRRDGYVSRTRMAAGGQVAGGGGAAGDTGAHGSAAGATGDGNERAAAAGSDASAGGDLVAEQDAGGIAAAAAAVGVSEAVSGGAEGMQEDGDGLVRGGDPPSAIAPAIVYVFWLPVGTFGQALGAWAETRSEEEHLKRRYNLAEDVWVDRAPLLEPYL